MSQSTPRSSGSSVIDEKVVAMKFDNRQFAKGVESTLKYCDELNKGLKFEGASKGLEKVSDSAKKLDLSGFEKSVDSVRVKLGTLETVAMTAISRMTNSLIDFGKKTIDTFAIKPVTTGFDEYQLKMNSTQTIMASTGEKLAVVNKYLDELNQYSDKTIYNFADMTANIGKFTNAGVNLKDAVAAIKGISNEAALSGANANEASRAMYNFSQAMSSGYVKLMDWKSIELANMATVSFKEELLNTAVEIGTVSKAADGMYNVLTQNATGSSFNEVISGTKNFNESLAYQWLTTDVLTKTLAKYADEETEIGKRAYQAAQDVKTFSMMMQTLTESAQSGWAETWQLIVGDFEQSKSLFTELTNFFGDIISSSAEARNQLLGNAMALQNAEGLTGREALWQSLLNILEHVKSVLGAVKEAWEDIFPPVTDQRLRGIIESLFQFTKGLDNSEERIQKIRQTFRGIFAILDMFVTIVRFSFRVATNAIKTFVNILEVVLFGGFQLLINWIEKVKKSDTGFNGWINRIGQGIGKFIEYISALDDLSFNSVSDAIKSFWDNVVGSIFNFDGLKKVLGIFSDDTKKILDKTSLDFKGAFNFDSLKEIFKNFGSGTVFSEIFTNMTEDAERANSRITGIFGGMVEFLISAKDAIVSVLTDIKNKFDSGELSFGQIFAAALGVTFILMLNTIRKFISSMGKAVEELGGVFRSLSGIFEGVKKILDNAAKVVSSFSLKIKSEALWNIAKSIALLAGSLALLTLLDPNKLYDSIKIMGLLAAGFIAISFAMTKMGDEKQSVKFAAVLIAMTMSIKSLAKTLSIINEMGTANLSKPLLTLAALSSMMLIIARTVGSSKRKYFTGIATLIGFAASLRMLVDVLGYVTSANLQGISNGLKVLYGLAGVLALVGIGFKNVKIGSSLAILAIIPSIKAMVDALDELNGMNISRVNESIGIIIKIFGTISLLMMVTSKMSENTKQMGSAILKISLSLVMIVGAFKLFAMLTPEEIDRAKGIVVQLLLLFTAIAALSKFAGENASKAGSMLMKMSVAIGILAGVMALLSLFKDSGQLKYPLKVISQLMLIMGAIVALTGFATKSKDLASAINKLTIAIVAISAMVTITSLIDPERLSNAAKAISMVVGIFGLLILSTKNVRRVDKTIITFTGAIIALGTIIGILSALKFSNVLQNAKALSILLLSLAASFRILQNTRKLGKTVLLQIATISAIVSALGGIIGALDKHNWMASISNAEAIGILLTSLAISFKILQNSKAIGWNAIAQIGVIASIASALGGVIGILNKYDWMASVSNAESIGILLLSLVTSFKILQGSRALDWTTVGQIAVLGLVVGALAAIVGGLEHLDCSVSIENALGLSVLLLAVSAASSLASVVGVAAPAAIIGIGVMMLMITAMGLLMAGIGAMRSSNPNVLDDLDFAIEVLEKIGIGMGSLIGGVIAGINIAVLKGFGTGLSEFGTAIQPFLDICRNIDPTAISNIGLLSSALLKLTASELLDAIASWLTGGNSLASFGKQLHELGTGIVDFSNVTSGINAGPHIEESAKAIETLAKIAQEIPNAGGLLSLIVGDNKMDDFAEQFPKLASGVVSFCYRTKNIDYGPHVQQASNAILFLARVAQEIPNAGGLLSMLVGDNTMDKFAEQIPIMANGVVSFCYRTKNIDYGPHVQYACNAILALARVSQEIPNTGGLLGLLVGNNDMDDFAEQLPIMAGGIVSFCYRTKNIDYGPHIQNACDAIRSIATVAHDIPNAGGLIAGLIGDNTIDVFGNGLPALGKGLNDFCESIDGIKTDDVDKSLDVARKIAAFSDEIANSGGLWQDIFGSSSVEEFGRQLTWLGYYLWVYSTWVDKISDYSKFHRSIAAVKSLADMALTINKTSSSSMSNFGKAMASFAETGLSEFSEKFIAADLQPVADTLANKMTTAIKNTRTRFVSAGIWSIDGFISGVSIRSKGQNSVQSKATDVTTIFLNAINKGFGIVNNLSQKMVDVGKYIVFGLKKGIAENNVETVNAANSLADSFMKAVETKLEIHSPSKWGEWVGNMTSTGISNGITSGSTSLLSGFGDIWNKMQGLASDGINSVKDIVGSNSLWDFTAPISDNLVNARDKLKEWLGFGGEGGLGDMFGFGSISEDLEEQIAGSYGGIQSGMGELANKIKSSGGGSGTDAVASNLSEALKLSLHKHFDFEEFIYLGKQIGDKMAIAANNAIVSKEKALGDTFAEVVAISAGGIDTWKAWSEDRKQYNKLAVKDELAGWTLIQKMYENGTKERMEADQEVYRLEQELVKGTFEYSKKWIDNEKYYNRLSLEEELAAWERVQKRYLEGSEERIEADKEVYRLKEEIRKKDYEDAKKWIEREKKYERLSLADELAAYRRILSTTSEGSDEREETNEKIYELEKEIYETQQKYIEDVKSAQEEANEKRVKLEQEYADKVKEINSKLTDDITSLNEEYNNSVKQRTQTLYRAYGLFDEVKQTDYDKDQLMSNLQDQVYAISNWRTDINNLSKRGLDKALLDELTEMGPSAAGQIRALVEMTDEELGKYNLLWSQKSSLVREQAISELEGLRVETSENIAQLQVDAANELDEYRKTWTDAMSKVSEDCSQKLASLKQEFGETVGTIKKDTEKKMLEMKNTANKILAEAGWNNTGKQIVNGISNGIESSKKKLMTTVGKLGILAVTALNASLKIRSPSKETEKTGMYAGEGLVRGLEAYEGRVHKAGSELGNEIQNGAYEAVRRVSDLFSNGVDNTITFVPVLDMSNFNSDINKVNEYLDVGRAVRLASDTEFTLSESRNLEFNDPNKDIVNELRDIRTDLGRLGDRVSRMQIVMDTGSLVGEIATPLDSTLGDNVTRNMRERV